MRRPIWILVALAVLSLAGAGGWMWFSRGPAGKPDQPVTLVAPNAVREMNQEQAGEPPGESVQTGEPAENLPPGAIEGRVWLEKRSVPAPGARVVMLPDGQIEGWRSATTDAEGRYRLEGLATGVYSASVLLKDWAMAPVPLEEQWIVVRSGEISAGVDRILLPGGVVHGQVVEAGSKAPLANALVQADPLFARTDEGGNFELEGLPVGRSFVTFSRPGLATQSVEVDLRKGENLFLSIALRPGATVRGTVLDSDGQAAHGAEVSLTAGLKYESLTDFQGKYSIDGLPLTARNFPVVARLGASLSREQVVGFPEGNSTVVVDFRLPAVDPELMRLSGRTLDGQGEPLSGVSLNLGDVQVDSDDDGAFEIEGPEQGELVARRKGLAPLYIGLAEVSEDERDDLQVVLEPGHFLAGTVIDASKRPVPWCQVWGESDREAFSAVTDEQGAFRLVDLPAEVADLEVWKPGFLRRTEQLQGIDREDLRIVLEEAGQISGVVTEKSSGAPVVDFLVDAGGSRLNFSSPAGTFCLRDLIPGKEYKLILLAEEHVDVVLEKLPAWPISADREPVKIELDRGKPFRGKVVDAASGKPLSGILVNYFRDRLMAKSLWEAAPDRTRLSGPDGQFEIPGLSDSEEPGSLLLDGPGRARVMIEKIVPSEAVRTFPLAIEAAVEGTVHDRAGKPIEDVNVRVSAAQEWFPEGYTDGEGHYRIAGLPPGEAKVAAGRASDRDLSQNVSLEAGKSSSLDFILDSGGISGRVTARGKGILNAVVFIQKIETERAFDFDLPRTDEDGRFRLGGLPPGKYKVWTQTGSGVLEKEVEVGDGEATCALVLPSGRIAGRMVTRSGIDPTSAEIEIHSLKSGMKRSSDAMIAPIAKWSCCGRTESEPPDHAFSFEGLAPGAYRILANAGELCAVAGPFTLEEDGTIEDLVIRLEDAGELAINVLDARDRSPIGGASVNLAVAGGISIPSFGTETGSDGSVVIHGLPRGRHFLTVDEPDHLEVEEAVDMAGGRVGKSILLARASWIAFTITPGKAADHAYMCLVSALSGNERGWRFRSKDGGHPLQNFSMRVQDGKLASILDGVDFENPVRLKAFPGHYRLNLQVFTWESFSSESPKPLLDKMFEVDVPPEGSAPIQLELPGS